MLTEFHLRIQRVLEQALRVAPAARESLIRQACAADTRLLWEVLSLLPHYVQMSGFEPRQPGGAGWSVPGTTTLQRVRTEAAAAQVAENEPKPPFGLDQYTIVQVLGQGGMGVVYRAVQPTQNRAVAIKILRGKLRTIQDRWRFMFEEEILRQLRHPGIARFIHSGVARLRPHTRGTSGWEERPYFVMEYVDGQPLTRFAATRALDVRQRLALLVEVCGALEYAHYRGIVHCDLKPDNILIDRTGRPKILDFGIARLAAWQEASTAQRACGGTLLYASPEQLLGRIEQITPASDVYALGLIAHELLTGTRPWREGWSVRLDLQNVHLEGDAPAAGTCNDEFCYYLRRILATTLRQHRHQMYRSAGELGAHVQELLAQFSAESRWQTLKRLWSTQRAPAAPYSPSALQRPLSVVVRARIARGLDSRWRAGAKRA